MPDTPVDTSMTEDVVVAGQETEATPAQQDMEITPEMIDEATKSRDTMKMAEYEKKLFGGDQGTPPASEATPQAPAAPSAGPKPADAKKFSIKYQGRLVEVEDPNGLLGYETTGHLKKATLHKDMRLRDLEAEIERHRKSSGEFSAKYQAAARELEEMRAKIREAETRSVAAPAAPTPAPSSVQKPVRPQYPSDLPKDAMDYTEAHWEKFHSYQRDLSDYTEKLSDYFESRMQAPAQSAPAASAGLPPEAQQTIAELKAQLDAVKAREQEIERQARENEYWSSISEFQGLHKEFSTPVPIQKLHKDVDKWMDDLARANGLQKPIVETGPEWTNYLNQKAAVTGKYLNGDTAVIAAAEGIDPPKGYDTYFKLGDLQRRRNEYVKRGVLGESADLHLAYLKSLDEAGELEEQINKMRAEERSAGANAIVGALEKSREFASAIPPDASQFASSGAAGGPSREDIEWFYGVEPFQLRSMGAEEKARYHGIAKALNFS